MKTDRDNSEYINMGVMADMNNSEYINMTGQ